MIHLIESSDISRLARPVAGNIDPLRVNAYINEAEQTQVKPVIGGDFFAYLLNGRLSTDDGVLLDGDGVFCGLRTALAYYSWAKLIKNNPINVTRFSTVLKMDENSQQISFSQIIKIHDDAVAYGDNCMREVVEFLGANADKYPLYKGASAVPRVKRSKVYVIGE